MITIASLEIKCKHCGEHVELNHRGRPRVYCKICTRMRTGHGGRFPDKMSHGVVQKICPTCKKEFLVWKSQASRYITCSRMCRSSNYGIFKCLQCGATFKRRLSWTSAFKFCSTRCHAENRTKGSITLICEGCSSPFQVKDFPTAMVRRFCSKECFLNQVSTKPGFFSSRRLIPLKICAFCQKEFKPRSRRQTFCSNTCSIHSRYKIRKNCEAKTF